MKILLLGSSIIKHWKNFTMNQQNEEVLNMGKSGLITSNLSSYLDKIPDITPEYIIFYCGTNDILRSFNKNDIVNNLQLCLDNLLKKYPDSIIIVISLIKSPIMYNGKLNEIDYINNSIRKYSKMFHNIQYMDVNRILCNINFFAEDKLHLTPIGYEKMNNRLHRFLYNN
jgi:lysophospholipase L1-like esterase